MSTLRPFFYCFFSFALHAAGRGTALLFNGLNFEQCQRVRSRFRPETGMSIPFRHGQIKVRVLKVFQLHRQERVIPLRDPIRGGSAKSPGQEFLMDYEKDKTGNFERGYS